MEIYKEREKQEYTITNKEGKKVFITLTSCLNRGINISLYGNKNSQFREYAHADFGYPVWPKVSKIDYDEENECFLFKDLIEIYDEYDDYDIPFTVDIYFYVDFNGNVISDAYSPIVNKYFPLDLKERYIPLAGKLDSCTLYKERKEQIGWEIISLMGKRLKRAKKKLLCQNNNL